MEFCQLDQNKTITNIIVCDNENDAAVFSAVPYYEGAEIGTEYVPVATEEEKTKRIAKSKSDLASYLETHPFQWTDGEYYSITQERQNQLMGTIAAAQIDGQPPEWNTSGGVCKTWDLTYLCALAVAIKDHVKALVKYQQTQEVAMGNAATMEELDDIVVDYDTVGAAAQEALL